MIKPQYGRTETVNCILNKYLPKIKDPVIVEFGMTRNPKGIWGDGHFTTIMGWYISNFSGTLYSVDIDSDVISRCSSILSSYGINNSNIHLIHDDALEWVKSINFKIDILYLDAWDYPQDNKIREQSEKNHLSIFQQISPWLSDNHIIVIDDILEVETWTGKGRLIIPTLLNNGYIIDSDSLVIDKHHPVYTLIFKKELI